MSLNELTTANRKRLVTLVTRHGILSEGPCINANVLKITASISDPQYRVSRDTNYYARGRALLRPMTGREVFRHPVTVKPGCYKRPG